MQRRPAAASEMIVRERRSTQITSLRSDYLINSDYLRHSDYLHQGRREEDRHAMEMVRTARKSNGPPPPAFLPAIVARVFCMAAC